MNFTWSRRDVIIINQTIDREFTCI